MPVIDHRRSDIYSLELTENLTNTINDNDMYYFADKKILGGTVFYKSPYSFAFTNIRCVVPGRILEYYF